MPRIPKIEDEERRAKVAKYFFQGWTVREIWEKVKGPRRVIEDDVKLIRVNLDRREIKKLQYRKNSCLTKIDLIQKLGWGMIEKHKNKPAMVATFGRLINASQELEAKVQGVIAEKIAGGADQSVKALLKELQEADKQAKGNGHKEEGAIAEPGS